MKKKNKILLVNQARLARGAPASTGCRYTSSFSGGASSYAGFLFYGDAMTTTREPISKKLRFEIFKRDGFSCAYCGNKPPDVVLEVDHIVAVSNGGNNSKLNLITSCFNCNRGKGCEELSSIPPKLTEDLAKNKEKESQLKEYRKYIEEVQSRQSNDIESINKAFRLTFPNWDLSDQFKRKTLTRFLKMLPLHEVVGAMQVACDRMSHDEDKAVKYFCGICWRKFDERPL